MNQTGRGFVPTVLSVHRRPVACVAAILCLSLPSVAASDAYFSSVGNNTVVEHDGFVRTVAQRLGDLRECTSRRIVRGEYESRKEFEARKRQLAVPCDSLRMLKHAALSEPVGLVYDADKEEFMFRFALNGRFDHSSDYRKGPTRLHGSFVHRRCSTATGPRRLYISRKSGGNPSVRIANIGFYRDGSPRSMNSSAPSKHVPSYDLECLDDRRSGFSSEFFSSVSFSFRPTLRQKYGRCSGGSRWSGAWYCDPAGKAIVVGGTVISVTAASPVAQARQLKAKEESLRVIARGVFASARAGKHFTFEVNRIELVDLETGRSLFHVEAGGA